MARRIKVDLPPVSKSTLKQLGMAIGPYGIIEEKVELPGAIAGEDDDVKPASDTIEDEDDDMEPAGDTIEDRDRDIAEPAEEALQCFPGPARERFMPNTVTGEDDDIKPASDTIKGEDGDMAEEALQCLPGPARKRFMPNKDNKSKVKFLPNINTVESDGDFNLISA